MAQDITNPGWRVIIPLLVGACMLIGSEPRRAVRARVQETAASDPIPFGKAIDREMSRGEKHNYSFTLTEGQFIQAVAEQRGIDLAVAIFGPDNELLTTVDRLNSTQGLETISLIAQKSGAYRLQIEAVSSSAARVRHREYARTAPARLPRTPPSAATRQGEFSLCGSGTFAP